MRPEEQPFNWYQTTRARYSCFSGCLAPTIRINGGKSVFYNERILTICGNVALEPFGPHGNQQRY